MWDDQSWFFIPRDSDHPIFWIIANLVVGYVIVCFLLLVVAK